MKASFIPGKLWLVLMGIACMVLLPFGAAQAQGRASVRDSAGVDSGGLRKPQVLKEAVVRARPPLIQRLIDRTVYNVESSITNNGLSVMDLMRKIPGVQVDPDGQISLNGKQGAVVYLDGRASYLSAEDLAALLRGMSASDIEKVELMSNPSAKYDAAGSGGIINIIRKRNRRQGWSGSVRGHYARSRYDSYDGGINAGYQGGPYNIALATSWSRNKTLSAMDMTTETFNNDHSLSGYQVSSAPDLNRVKGNNTYLNADVNLSSRTMLSFSGTGNFQSVLDVTSSYSGLWSGAGVKMGSLSFYDVNKSRSSTYDLGFRLAHKTDTAGGEWSLDLNFSTYPGNPVQTITNSRYDAYGALMADSLTVLLRDRTLDIYVARIDYALPLPGKARLEMGAKSSYVKARNEQQYLDDGDGTGGGSGGGLGGGPGGGTNGGSGDAWVPGPVARQHTSETINALYANMNRQFGKMRMQAGLRAEQSSTQGETWQDGRWQGKVRNSYLLLFPSLSLEYELHGQDRLGFQLSRRVIRPSYRQLNPLPDPSSATQYYQGDTALRPQINLNAEVSYSWHNALTVDAGSIWYSHFFRNFSFPDSDGVRTARMPAGIGKGYGIYLEFTHTQKIFPWWSMNNSVNVYQRWYKGLVRGIPVAAAPVVTINVEGSNDLRIDDKWSAELDFKFVSPRQLVSSRAGSYGNISLGIRRSFFDGRASVTLMLYNPFETEGNTWQERTGNLYQHGYLYTYSRALNLHCSYRFGKGPERRTRRASEEGQRAGNPG